MRRLFLISLTVLFGCSPRPPDFVQNVAAPSGTKVASLAGYQPRGTIEGYLTIKVAARQSHDEPQLTFGHMLNVRAGWLDEQTFALVYERLEPRRLQSPVYTTGLANSRVEIVLCNARYVDCSPLLHRLSPKHTLIIKQFPEGDWPRLR